MLSVTKRLGRGDEILRYAQDDKRGVQDDKGRECQGYMSEHSDLNF